MAENGIIYRSGPGPTIGQAAGNSADELTHQELDNNFFSIYGVTNGTALESKAVILDANKNIASLGTVGCGAITSTGTSAFGDITVGGGYGSTGITVSAAGVIQANGAITSDGVITGGTLTDGTFSVNGGTVSAGTWEATDVGVAHGGTGLSSWTTGDIVYSTGATTLAGLGIGTAGQVLATNSTPDAPEWIDNEIVFCGTISNGTVGASTTYYLAPNGGKNETIEGYGSITMPISGTLKKLYTTVGANVSTAGNLDLAIRVNGVTSSVATQYGPGITGDKSDLVNTVSVTAGQKVTFLVDNGGDSLCAGITWSFVLVK